MARVDETPYVLFGAPKGVKGSEKAKQMNITYTASHTIVDLSAGSTNFILDFFSPVDPGNDIRQSLPYSYLSVSVTSSSAHNISIFSAIDGTWVGSDQSRVESKHTRMGNNSIFEMSNKNAITFAEEDQMAAWGETVFATTGTSNVVASVASQDDVLSAFTKTGSLTEPDSSYKPGDLVALSQSFKRCQECTHDICYWALSGRCHKLAWSGRSYRLLSLQISRSQFFRLPFFGRLSGCTGGLPQL